MCRDAPSALTMEPCLAKCVRGLRHPGVNLPCVAMIQVRQVVMALRTQADDVNSASPSGRTLAPGKQERALCRLLSIYLRLFICLRSTLSSSDDQMMRLPTTRHLPLPLCESLSVRGNSELKENSNPQSIITYRHAASMAAPGWDDCAIAPSRHRPPHPPPPASETGGPGTRRLRTCKQST